MNKQIEDFKSLRTARARQMLRSFPRYFNELRDIETAQDFIGFLQYKIPYVFNVPSFPPRITLELINQCNFSCRHCWRTLIKRERGSLDYELAEKIVDEISQHPKCIIKIGGMGEPSLYKDCGSFMKLLRDRKIKHIFFTNGSLFDRFSYEEILSWRIQHLVVSIDGIDTRTYEYLRVGGNYNKLITNLQAFKEKRDQISHNQPIIDVRHVILPSETTNNISEFKRSLLQIADTLSFNYLEPKEPVEVSNLGRSRGCRDIRREMYIRSNGKVLLCGAQEHTGFAPEWLVDTHTTSIKEAWHHPRIKEIRRHHKKGSNLIPDYCKVCVQTM